MANNPYVNKVQLADGTTLIDLTDATAGAAQILEGYTAYGATGQKLTGTASGQALIITDTVDEHGGTIRTITGKVVQLQSKTITLNGTYDAEDDNADGYTSVTVNVPTGTPTIQSLSVTPSESEQTFNSSSVDGYKPVTVGAISSTYVGTGISRKSSTDLQANGKTVTVPAGYYSSQATKDVATGSATPTASISGSSASVSTGTNTLTLTKSVSNTPQVSAGYISAGTAGNTSISLTASVTTKSAATITPSTSNQTIASGTYLTGTQTISGDANLVGSNIISGTSIFGVSGSVVINKYYTGTSAPSSSLGNNGDIYFKTV